MIDQVLSKDFYDALGKELRDKDESNNKFPRKEIINTLQENIYTLTVFFSLHCIFPINPVPLPDLPLTKT